MDPKYYSLVEIVVFAVFGLGFCAYQIWSVRRKSGDTDARPDNSAETPDADDKK